MNARLLADDPPGWSAEELDELLPRAVRIAAFHFPSSIPERSCATRSSPPTRVILTTRSAGEFICAVGQCAVVGDGIIGTAGVSC
jgi:hypothetical protein